jgi:hypothetical protein
LTGIWQTWEKSGHKEHRPRSFVFMPSSNPVQEAILAHWGITLLMPESGACLDDALVASLQTSKQEFARHDGKPRSSLPAQRRDKSGHGFERSPRQNELKRSAAERRKYSPGGRAGIEAFLLLQQ